MRTRSGLRQDGGASTVSAAGRTFASSQPVDCASPSISIGWAGSASIRTEVTDRRITPSARSPVRSRSFAAACGQMCRMAAAEDDQVEPAVGRVDRMARTEAPGHQLAGVGDEREETGQLDDLSVGDDPELRPR